MDNIKILDVKTVDAEQLPTIISSQFNELTELDTKIKEIQKKAEEAKKKANDSQISVKLLNKKEAIELLQDAIKSLAIAQAEEVDAQEKLFTYQKKLTEITKYLFGLGVSSIAMNRSVVRELDLKLKGASDKEISELAKQELLNVINQLNAQRDMMDKQEKLTERVKENGEHINNLRENLDEGLREQKEEIAEINKTSQQNSERMNSLQNNVNKQVALLEDKLRDLKKAFQTDICNISKEFDKKLLEIDVYIKNENKEINNRIDELNFKMDKLQYNVKKRGWKFKK